jgi:hypothetical protein
MNHLQKLVSRLLLLFALTAGLMATPLVAGPLSFDPDPPSLIKHLRAEIGSKDALRQESALMDVIMLSRCEASCTVTFLSIPDKMLRVENESGVGRTMDLDALVPDLMKAYRTSPVAGHDGHRLLALSALVNIGNATSLEQLVAESSDRSSQQSNRVNNATQRSLAAYYLEKYPELTKKMGRSQSFSIEDVQRAETVRVKLAKKDAKAAARN